MTRRPSTKRAVASKSLSAPSGGFEVEVEFECFDENGNIIYHIRGTNVEYEQLENSNGKINILGGTTFVKITSKNLTCDHNGDINFENVNNTQTLLYTSGNYTIKNIKIFGMNLLIWDISLLLKFLRS